jgi:hypothetical protein
VHMMRDYALPMGAPGREVPYLLGAIPRPRLQSQWSFAAAAMSQEGRWANCMSWLDKAKAIRSSFSCRPHGLPQWRATKRVQ